MTTDVARDDRPQTIMETVTEATSNAAADFARLAGVVGRLGGDEAAEQCRADATMFALHFAAAGAQYAFEQDPAYPVMEKFLSFTGKAHGVANPDCSYHHAMLDAAYTYRVSGNRGTVRLIDADVATHTIADRAQVTSDSFAKRGIDLPLGEDFEIILSREPQDGLWLQLPPEGQCFIIFREYAYDWDTEIPATLRIERVDASYPPPPTTPAVLAERAKQFAQWMKCEYLVPNREAILAKEPNTLESMSFGQANLQTNHYMNGVLVCQPDEVLVIEMPAPDAFFWTLGVFDSIGSAAHPHMRITSINGHQARIDPDGMFRAVVAHRDPGYANWLDAAGHRVMITMFRGNQLKSVPQVKITRGSFDALPSLMPADSHRVSHDERQVLLRRRLESAYRRLMLDY